jgi:hypothetical protein
MVDKDKIQDDGLTPEELEQQDATGLPDRNVMSVIATDPGIAVQPLPVDPATTDTSQVILPAYIGPAQGQI